MTLYVAVPDIEIEQIYFAYINTFKAYVLRISLY